MKEKKDLKAQMEELFAAVEAMESGGEFGGLEKLFEERFKQIKTQDSGAVVSLFWLRAGDVVFDRLWGRDGFSPRRLHP